MSLARLIPSVLLVCIVLGSPVAGSAAADAHTLQQAVLALKHQPSDDKLRTQVIQLSQQMHPAPAIPSRARQDLDTGARIRENAEGISDYQRAVTEYRAAIAEAPWWGEAYLKASDALQDAGLYDEAIKDLQFYILTNPGDSAVTEAKEKIDSAKAAKQYEEEAEKGN